jgi:hypothetical protein
VGRDRPDKAVLEAFTQTALWQQYPGPPAVFEEHWEGTYRAEHTDYVAGATSCDPVAT